MAFKVLKAIKVIKAIGELRGFKVKPVSRAFKAKTVLVWPTPRFKMAASW